MRWEEKLYQRIRKCGIRRGDQMTWSEPHGSGGRKSAGVGNGPATPPSPLLRREGGSPDRRLCLSLAESGCLLWQQARAESTLSSYSYSKRRCSPIKNIRHTAAACALFLVLATCSAGRTVLARRAAHRAADLSRRRRLRSARAHACGARYSARLLPEAAEPRAVRCFFLLLERLGGELEASSELGQAGRRAAGFFFSFFSRM